MMPASTNPKPAGVSGMAVSNAAASAVNTDALIPSPTSGSASARMTK